MSTVPGVVSHSTNVVEHPELVRAHRELRQRRRERECHRRNRLRLRAELQHRALPSFGAVGKLEALVDGARLASQELLGR